jgi:hydrogenase expression/formation protein HypC
MERKMCLSIPAKIIEKNGDKGKVDIEGNILEVNFTLLPETALGDYVIVHAGFAIQRYDQEEALKTLELIKEAFGGNS